MEWTHNIIEANSCVHTGPFKNWTVYLKVKSLVQNRQIIHTSHHTFVIIPVMQSTYCIQITHWHGLIVWLLFHPVSWLSWFLYYAGYPMLSFPWCDPTLIGNRSSQKVGLYCSLKQSQPLLCNITEVLSRK